MSEPTVKTASRLDQFAVGLSVLCVVQCLIAPLMLVLFPSVFAAFLAGEQFHQILALVIVPVSLVAMFVGCRKHRQWEMLIPAGLGLAAIVGAVVAGEAVLGEAGEVGLTLLGAALLALAHVINFRLCRRHLACHC